MRKRERKRPDVGPYEPARKVERDKFNRQFSPPDTGTGSGSIHVRVYFGDLHKLWCEHRRLEYKLRALRNRRRVSRERLDSGILWAGLRKRFSEAAGRFLRARFVPGSDLYNEPKGGLEVVVDGWQRSIGAYNPVDFGAPPSLMPDNVRRDSKGNAVEVSRAWSYELRAGELEATTVPVGQTSTGAYVRLSDDPYTRGTPANREVAFDRWRGQWPNTLGLGSAENPARVEVLVLTRQVEAPPPLPTPGPSRPKPKCLFCRDLIPWCNKCGGDGSSDPSNKKSRKTGRPAWMG